MFFKKKEVDHHAKKFDKLITWLIIGWAVASMVGLSKTDKWKEIVENANEKSKEITENVKEEGTKVAKKSYKLFWKVLVWVLKIFNKK